MTLVKLLIQGSVFLVMVGCSQARFETPPLSKRDHSTTPPPAPAPSLVFNREGSPLPSPYLRGTKDDDEYSPPQWEITKTFRAGRTRVTGVRHNGQTTERYTSTEGPNGRSERRRVTSTSGDPHRHRHP